jgi:hypothetical protein
MTEVNLLVGCWFPQKNLRISFDKKSFGYISYDFFANPSGHAGVNAVQENAAARGAGKRWHHAPVRPAYLLARKSFGKAADVVKTQKRRFLQVAEGGSFVSGGKTVYWGRTDLFGSSHKAKFRLFLGELNGKVCWLYHSTDCLLIRKRNSKQRLRKPNKQKFGRKKGNENETVFLSYENPLVIV